MKRLLVIATLFLMGGAAQAQVLPFRIPMYLAKIPSAVHFDGNTGLGTTNGLFNLPSQSQNFYLSFWYKSNTPPGNTGYQTIVESLNEQNDVVAQVIFSINRQGGYDAWLSFLQGCDTTTNVCAYVVLNTTDGTVLYDDNWHRLRFDVRLGPPFGPRGSYSSDLGPDLPLNSSIDNNQVTITVPWQTVASWAVGGSIAFDTVYYQGDMAELYMSMDGLANGAPDSDFVGGGPAAVGLGFYGSGPTSNIPQLLMRGSIAHFILGPAIGSSPPSYQFVWFGSGEVDTADSDPCAANWFSYGCAPIR